MSGERLLAKLSWSRFMTGLGSVIATAGAALILITFITMIINPGDDTGGLVASIAFVLILIAAAVWSWLYVGRYGVHGILPERRDESSIFRSRKEKDVPVEAPEPAPAPQVTVVNPGVATAVVDQDFDDHEDEGDDDDSADEEEFIFDDELAEEQESRYAKYRMHHPEEDGYTSLFDSEESDYVGDQSSTAGEGDANGIPVQESSDDPVIDERAADDRTEMAEAIELRTDERPVAASSSASSDAAADTISTVEDAALEPIEDAEAPSTPEVTSEEADSPALSSTASESETDTRAKEDLDVIERTTISSSESGRAEALRNLRARRSGKTQLE